MMNDHLLLHPLKLANQTRYGEAASQQHEHLLDRLSPEDALTGIEDMMNKLLLFLMAVGVRGTSNDRRSDALPADSGGPFGDKDDNDTLDHAGGSLSRELEREDDLLAGAVPSRDDSEDGSDGDGGISGGGLANTASGGFADGGVGRPSDPPDESAAVDDSDSSNSGSVDNSESTGNDPAEEVPDKAPSETGGDDGAERQVVSVPITPPVALSFHCDDPPVPCDGAARPMALKVVEAAAEEHLRESPLWMSAVEFDVQAEEGVEYEGVDLTLGLPVVRRRRHRRSSEEPIAETSVGERTHVRRRRSASEEWGAHTVSFSGTASFVAPSDLSPNHPAIPSASHLSQLLLTIFVQEQAAVVDRIRSKASGAVGEKSWLNRMTGYEAAFESDLAKQHSDNAQGDVVASANQSINSDTTSTASSSSGGNNLLLLIGAGGAAFSLLLLIGGLCYAKKSYNANGGSHDAKKKRMVPNDDGVVFQPGKNNPRRANTTSSIFKKLSGSGDALECPKYPAGLPPPMPLAGEATKGDDEDDDDESHKDFLLARAALKGADDASSQADNTLDGDMSFAFTVDGESLAPLGDKSAGSSRKEDAAIGAGGLASFANDKGVFRWNEEGTKMVYTPNVVAEGGGGDQNGFVYDEGMKKWVVKEQVIGEKNVSFKANPAKNGEGGGGPPSVLRTRSNDSVGTGVTGLTEFSYGDVALDTKRSRSAGTERSGDDGTVSTLGLTGRSIVARGRGDTAAGPTPPSPGTPRDQGVEVTAEASAGIVVTPSKSFDGEFVPNTNVERYMRMGVGTVDDDSTAFSDFTGSAFGNSMFNSGALNNSASNNSAVNSCLSNSNGSDGSLPRAVTPEREREPPRDVTPERVPSQGDATTGSAVDPGRIVPKKAASRPNKMAIAEDAPFDEDIPFDERPPSSSGAKKGPSSQKRSEAGLILPNMIDDVDDRSLSEGSEETSNSEQVLEDLDKLSRFMMERKRSSKSQSGSTASSRRRRKGGANIGAINGSAAGVGGGRRLGAKGRPANYVDPSRGL